MAGLCAGLFLAACFLPLEKCVGISERKNEDNAFYSKKALDGFVISYTHSVNKGRVHDYLFAEGYDLRVEKSVFVSYGAGIPEVQDAPDAVFTITNDGYCISWNDRRMSSFDMAVGLVANHSLTVGGKEIPMQELFPPQTGIRFKVRRVPIIKYCLRNIDS